jgi:hypothetical protein
MMAMCGEIQNTGLLALADKLRKSASETRYASYASMFLTAAAELEARARQLTCGQMAPGTRAGSLNIAC